MTSSSRPRAEATPGWTVSLQALEKGIRDRARKENSSGLWMCRPGTDHRERERQRERERERERVMGQRSNEREIFFPWSLLDRGININGIGAWLWRCRTLWLEGNNDEHDARDSRSSTQQQIYALYYANARTHARTPRSLRIFRFRRLRNCPCHRLRFDARVTAARARTIALYVHATSVNSRLVNSPPV